jgi:hypothetical protein
MHLDAQHLSGTSWNNTRRPRRCNPASAYAAPWETPAHATALLLLLLPHLHTPALYVKPPVATRDAAHTPAQQQPATAAAAMGAAGRRSATQQLSTGDAREAPTTPPTGAATPLQAKRQPLWSLLPLSQAPQLLAATAARRQVPLLLGCAPTPTPPSLALLHTHQAPPMLLAAACKLLPLLKTCCCCR